MAIPDRHAPFVLQELSPSVGRSTADYGEHAVDVRIRGRQSSRKIHLDETPRFYEGFRAPLLAWVSYVAYERDLQPGGSLLGFCNGNSPSLHRVKRRISMA
jgi:hypothetical protein